MNMVKRLKFTIYNDGCWAIENEAEEYLGYLERIRVGAWMSWVLFLNEGCYMSAGCLDEIRIKMKELNAMANKPNSQSD